MKIQLTQFRGAIPKLRPQLVPAGSAQEAINTAFDDGTLSPIQQASIAHTFDNVPADFVAHDGEFLPFSAKVWAAPGPVKADRLYYCVDGSAPKVRFEDDTVHDLAVDAPSAPPAITLDYIEDDEDDPLPRETIFMVYTFVTPFGEESLPSPVSDSVDIAEEQTAVIALPDNMPPTGSRIDRMRIYRTQTSASGVTEFYFIDEVNAGVASVAYDPAVQTMQEVLPSADYDTPPTDLKGLTVLPNGFMAGFTGKTLCFSEPWQPHAWPIKYQLQTEYDIVGLGVTGNLLAVLTTGTPYLAQGSAPDSVQLERQDMNLPCLSGDGIVDMGGSIAYPSPEGLVLLTSGSPQVVTGNTFTRKQWAAMNPASFDAAHTAGRYVFAYTPEGESAKLGVIDLTGAGREFTRLTLTPGAMRYDLATGDLLMLSGDDVIRLDDREAGYMTLTWTSGQIMMPAPVSFGVAMIEGEALDDPDGFSATITRDGVDILTTSVMNEFFRLPDGLGTRWEIKVTGRVQIDRITIAGEPSDLYGG